MDIDLELDSDRISDFLRSKLDEIKSSNAHLEAALRHRQQVVSDLRQEIARNNDGSVLKLGEVWKRTTNSRYVLGVSVRNQSQLTLDNIGVTLDWTSPSPLIYRFHLVTTDDRDSLTDGLKSTPHLAHCGQIVITLDSPLFTDHLSYTVSASISFQQNNKRTIVKLPSTIQLTPQDVTDNSVIVHSHRVIDGNIEDLLALVFAGEKHEFVAVILGNWSRSFESILEVDCSLCRINTVSKRKFFLAHKVCPSLDGSLLEVDNSNLSRTARFSAYCKDLQAAAALLHYLHRHIIDVCIIPEPFHEPDLSSSELRDSLRKSLFEEIECLELGSKSDLEELREKMVELEQRTDKLVVRINKKLNS